MLLQRWEAKIRWKEKSPQPGIELTTTRSWVRHAHHCAILAGPIIWGTSTYNWLSVKCFQFVKEVYDQLHLVCYDKSLRVLQFRCHVNNKISMNWSFDWKLYLIWKYPLGKNDKYLEKETFYLSWNVADLIGKVSTFGIPPAIDIIVGGLCCSMAAEKYTVEVLTCSLIADTL